MAERLHPILVDGPYDGRVFRDLFVLPGDTLRVMPKGARYRVTERERRFGMWQYREAIYVDPDLDLSALTDELSYSV